MVARPARTEWSDIERLGPYWKLDGTQKVVRRDPRVRRQMNQLRSAFPSITGGDWDKGPLIGAFAQH